MIVVSINFLCILVSAWTGFRHNSRLRNNWKFINKSSAMSHMAIRAIRDNQPSPNQYIS